MIPIVAIVGRPNVGKSTLFNRLSRSRDALVDDHPGITRDRLYALVSYGGISFSLVDTGGFQEDTEDALSRQVTEQVETALEEADKVLFVVDGRQGLTPADEAMGRRVRKLQKKTLLIINKVDGPELEHLIHDFYVLGFSEIYSISAAHGYGIRTLMDAIVHGLPKSDFEEKEREDEIRIAVLGRPNVGKSSLINRILGRSRLLVSEVPGTTRDAVDTHFHFNATDYVLIDTAGIRRKAKTKAKLEKFSVIKALQSLDRCHVAVILMDASEGILDQDTRICGYAHERGRGVVLGLNKWDLVKSDPEQRTRLDHQLERHLKFLSYAPLVRVSALTGERVLKLFDKIERVYTQLRKRIPTPSLNQALAEIVRQHPPPRAGRRPLKIYYATQKGSCPPTFIAFVNRPEFVHFSYERFLVNQIRKRFELDSTPIRLLFRQR